MADDRASSTHDARAGRALDRRRIHLLTGVHRLSELADYADDAEHAPAMVKNVAEWATR